METDVSIALSLVMLNVHSISSNVEHLLVNLTQHIADKTTELVETCVFLALNLVMVHVHRISFNEVSIWR